MNYKIPNQLVWLIITVTVFLFGCGPTISKSSKINLIAVSSGGQSLTYQDGKQWIVSRKDFNNVGIHPVKDLIEPYGIAYFYIDILNNDLENLNFSTDNIKAYCGDRIIKVFTYDEALNHALDIAFPTLKASDLAGLTAEQVVQVMSLPRHRPSIQEEKILIEQLKKYSSLLLKRKTVLPKSHHRGIFNVEHPVGEDILKIEVITPYETHKFTFRLQKR